MGNLFSKKKKQYTISTNTIPTTPEPSPINYIIDDSIIINDNTIQNKIDTLKIVKDFSLIGDEIKIYDFFKFPKWLQDKIMIPHQNLFVTEEIYNIFHDDENDCYYNIYGLEYELNKETLETIADNYGHDIQAIGVNKMKNLIEIMIRGKIFFPFYSSLVRNYLPMGSSYNHGPCYVIINEKYIKKIKASQKTERKYREIYNTNHIYNYGIYYGDINQSIKYFLVPSEKYKETILEFIVNLNDDYVFFEDDELKLLSNKLLTYEDLYLLKTQS